MAKEAHTDGTRVVQCQSDDQNFMKTTIMQIPMDYLEIPEPSLPRGFLELAEEARNVNVEIEQCCYIDEVQTQEAGLARPVSVTVMEYSSSVLNVGTTIAPSISTERIPPIFSAGRRSPVDQLGLVGPWNKTVQSVFRMTSYDDRDSRADLDPAYGIHLHDPRMMEYMGAPESARLLCRSPKYWLEHMGRDRAVAAALRLHNDASLIMTNVQVMAQFVTSLNRTASEVMRMVYDKEPFPTDAVQFVTPGRRVRLAAHYMAVMGLWHPTSGPVFPVGSDGMLFTCDSDKPKAEGPVGQYVTRSPVGSDGMLSTCDSDQPKEGGPVVPQTAFQYHRNVAICRK